VTLALYLGSGHFLSATFENWESEFLQMGMYVLLTVWLHQRGSAESRPLDPADEEERIDPGPAPCGSTARCAAGHSSCAHRARFCFTRSMPSHGSLRRRFNFAGTSLRVNALAFVTLGRSLQATGIATGAPARARSE